MDGMESDFPKADGIPEKLVAHKTFPGDRPSLPENSERRVKVELLVGWGDERSFLGANYALMMMISENRMFVFFSKVYMFNVSVHVCF